MIHRREPKKVILWITQNPDSDEVKSKVESHKEIFQEKGLNLLPSAKEAFEFIKKDQKAYFSLIYVICEDIFFEEWGRLYKDRILELNNLCATVILSTDLSKAESLPFFKDPLVNPGGAVTSIEGAIEYIQKDECNWTNILNTDIQNPFQFRGEGFGKFFKKIESLEEIGHKELFKETMSEDLISEEDLKKFTDYLFSYKNKKINSVAKPSQEKNIPVPKGILSKYFMRLYDLECDFYKDINRNLTHEENVPFYQVYINILYFGLRNGLFPHFNSGPLYRGTKLAMEDFEEMKQSLNERNQLRNNSPEAPIKPVLYSSREFLGFSQEEKIAELFLKHTVKRDVPNTLNAEFILNPSKDHQHYIPTNIDVTEAGISLFPKEKEVVFLPFSCYEIMDISTKDFNGKELYVITMEQVAQKI